MYALFGIAATATAAGRIATVSVAESSLAEIVNVLGSSEATVLVVVHKPRVAPVEPPDTSAVLRPAKGNAEIVRLVSTPHAAIQSVSSTSQFAGLSEGGSGLPEVA